jgi:hypothetical protein
MPFALNYCKVHNDKSERLNSVRNLGLGLPVGDLAWICGNIPHTHMIENLSIDIVLY